MRGSRLHTRLAFVLASAGLAGALFAEPQPAAAAERVVKRVSFGEHLLGSAGRTESISIENGLTTPVQVGSLALGGYAPDLFAIQSDACSGRTLAFLETCHFTVHFTPSRVPGLVRRTPGPVAFDPARGALATVKYTRSGSADTSVVALDGRVLRPAALALGNLDRSYRFEAVAAGREGKPRLFHIGNLGDVPAALGKLSLSGAGAEHFQLRHDTCSLRTLNPAPPCTYEVLFRPRRPGLHSASVVVAGADPATTTATISGMARPTVKATLRVLARQWAPKLSARRLARAVRRDALFLGTYSMPLAARLDASLVVRSAGRTDRRVAVLSQEVIAHKRQAVRMAPTARALRVLKRPGVRPRFVLRLELVEPSAARTVAARAVRLR